MSGPSLLLILQPEELLRVRIDALNSSEEARLLDDLNHRRPRLLAEIDDVIDLLERRAERWAPGDISPRRAA